MRTLVLATRNPGKISELRSIMAGESLPFEVVGIDDHTPGLPEPEETGSTFVENAAIKALAYAKATGELCIADDSGLAVDALDGAPGVISSHYCTDGVERGMSREERDSANNEKLLGSLDSVPAENRSARFVCVMVLAAPDNPIPMAVSKGSFEGRIGEPPRVPAGDQGFGYDPLFLVAPVFESTSAELDRETKNGLSHRGAALRGLIGQLRTL